MTTIQLLANEQELSVVSQPKIASGDMQSVELAVKFSGHWSDYEKSAVFFTSANNTVYEIRLTEGRCTVPHEVLDKECSLFIGVRGVNPDAVAVKTTTLVKYKIERGAPAGTGTAVDPTPDVYMQILAELRDIRTHFVTIENLDEAVARYFVDHPVNDGDSAYEIAVKKGFQGSESEWLASLKGDDYILTENDKSEIADAAYEKLAGVIENTETELKGTDAALNERLTTVEDSLTSFERGTGDNSIQQAGNKAISENAFATGENNIAGCRAFTIESYNGKEFTLLDATGLAKAVAENDKVYCSLIVNVSYTDTNGKSYSLELPMYNYTRIISVNGNVVTLSRPFEIDSYVTVDSITHLITFDFPELGDVDYAMSSTAQGIDNEALGYGSRVNGTRNRTIGNHAVAEGYELFATTYGRATGTGCKANGRNSEATGKNAKANGFGSISKGLSTSAYGSFTSAEGFESVAGDESNGDFLYKYSVGNPIAAKAEGIRTLALTKGSHAQNKSTVAGSKGYRITEITPNGNRIYTTTKVGLAAGQTISIVTDKVYTAVIKQMSTSYNRFDIEEAISGLALATDKNGVVLTTDPKTGLPINYLTVVGEPLLGDIEVGLYADASGVSTFASGSGSSARGMFNKDEGQHIIDSVGNGKSDDERSNAYTLDNNGNAIFAGDVYVKSGTANATKLGGENKLYLHSFEMYDAYGSFIDIYFSLYSHSKELMKSFSAEYDYEIEDYVDYLPDNHFENMPTGVWLPASGSVWLFGYYEAITAIRFNKGKITDTEIMTTIHGGDNNTVSYDRIGTTIYSISDIEITVKEV